MNDPHDIHAFLKEKVTLKQSSVATNGIILRQVSALGTRHLGALQNLS